MAEVFIDALGDFCPVPVIKAQKAVRNMPPGAKVVLLTDHSCTASTLQEEMAKRGLVTRVEEVDYGIWRITISRRPDKLSAKAFGR